MRWHLIALMLAALELAGCPQSGQGTVPNPMPQPDPPAPPTESLLPRITEVTPRDPAGLPAARATFVATATHAPITWQWVLGGGAAPQSSTEASPNVRLGDIGSYTGSVVACNEDGCSEP